MSEEALRLEIVETAQAMSRDGLSPGRSGNVSARFEDGMLITPSGLAYETLRGEDLVRVAGDGAVAPDALKPSSEWRMHLAVYAARRDLDAVVHCHSINATALACAQKPIPAFHYMVAAAGGSNIPLASYATFGTAALAENVRQALADRNAALLAHHGQIAAAATPLAALTLARDIETLAMQYCRVLQIGGGPILDAEEMARVLEAFRGYGQQ